MTLPENKNKHELALIIDSITPKLRDLDITNWSINITKDKSGFVREITYDIKQEQEIETTTEMTLEEAYEISKKSNSKKLTKKELEARHVIYDKVVCKMFPNPKTRPAWAEPDYNVGWE